jgi:OmpA-OmpF porin, OOP family
MKNAMLLMLLALATVPGSAAAQQKDTTGCTDHPLFTRMPTYWIRSCNAKEFDARTIPAGEGKLTVEGRTWELVYSPQATAKTTPSELQILRNFENAVATLGGTVQASSKSRRTFKIEKDGREFWVEVRAEFTGKHGLTIMEKGAMEQDIVASAEVFASDLKRTGRAVVEGIYFDTGSPRSSRSQPGRSERLRSCSPRTPR